MGSRAPESFAVKRLMRKFLSGILWIVVSLIGGLLLAELVAQLYVYTIAKKGKLMQPDTRLGWKHLPNLDLKRLNSNGQIWHIQTNSDGYRTSLSWNAQAQTRILILGDSFAFGEGVNQEERFDSIMERNHSSWNIKNLGVMGYGTDQQLLAGQQYFPELRAGDVLVLLTFSNDYIDILRQRFAGRAKPWFEYTDGNLILHVPVISFREWLRDKSYLASKVSSFLEPELYDYSAEDVKQGIALYKAIVQTTIPPLLERGVKIIIAHHGEGILGKSVNLPEEFFEEIFPEISNHPNFQSVPLDTFLQAHSAEPLFLNDGHWNPRGHKLVAEIVVELIKAELE
jgi:hypothetical protein